MASVVVPKMTLSPRPPKISL